MTVVTYDECYMLYIDILNSMENLCEHHNINSLLGSKMMSQFIECETKNIKNKVKFEQLDQLEQLEQLKKCKDIFMQIKGKLTI